MKINKNEQDFVLKYFQPGKLDTRKALQKVKARVGIADEEVSHTATVSLRMRRIRWIAVAASILVLLHFCQRQWRRNRLIRKRL